jgi:hypothetical protein
MPTGQQLRITFYTNKKTQKEALGFLKMGSTLA